ncbi:hypothetical protein [Herbaspirillum hiltneri]|uniref:hypothetical protein n=1 Tax=Herbaspirillum hiltneri TaxID=341045 RepID=UPI000B030965|nr:hypothetical protein [Herbaspirillum hiltneri]
MKSVKFIDLLIEKKGLKNDVAVCKELGWSSGQISQYRSGKNIMNNEACIALAIALEDDPMKIIMAADLDRAERSGHKSLWEVFSKQAAMATGAVVLGGVTLLLSPTPSEAASLSHAAGPNDLHYVKFAPMFNMFASDAIPLILLCLKDDPIHIGSNLSIVHKSL